MAYILVNVARLYYASIQRVAMMCAQPKPFDALPKETLTKKNSWRARSQEDHSRRMCERRLPETPFVFESITNFKYFITSEQ